MGSEMELHQAIYFFLLTQIQFGFYQYFESLPAMEELCRQYHISIDTVKPAYHRLRREGYISLSQKAGAKVTVKYSREEINQYIQQFFAHRKTAFFDLDQSLWALFGWAEWLSLKHSPPETTDQIEQLSHDVTEPLNVIWRHIELKFSALGNDLFIRLMRYIYLFFHGPFYCIRENSQHLGKHLCRQQKLTELLRSCNWDTVASIIYADRENFSNSFKQFYDEKITSQPFGKEIVFCWDAYKKSSQLRYTLTIELLTDISRGIYPEGSRLPSAERIAIEKGVSVSTVRRTIRLLNCIGAVKSSRPLGACVVPPAQSTENCDFTQPDIKSRLLDLTASLQIFTLSAKAVSRITLASLDADSICQWKQRLGDLHQGQRYELVTYTTLELISKFAPYHTIRTIYSELLRLLFWGNPLRGMRGDPHSVHLYFAPYFNRMLQSLEELDFVCFSTTLEELLLHELRVTVEGLIQQGIPEVQTILVPAKEEIWN